MDTRWSARPWISCSRWRSRDPNAPEFREALVKRLGEAPIKAGEAFDSNGPDFVWAVEAATQPTIVVDDQPAGAMRRIAGTNLWFHTGQLRVGTSHRFHYIIDGKRFGGSYDVPAYGPLSYARAGRPAGPHLRKARPYQQALRRHGIQLLDLCPGAVRPGGSRRVDGLAGRRTLHDAERRRDRAACARVCTACRKSPTI